MNFPSPSSSRALMDVGNRFLRESLRLSLLGSSDSGLDAATESECWEMGEEERSIGFFFNVNTCTACKSDRHLYEL